MDATFDDHKRFRDQGRGFTYFQSFDELRQWDEDNADPVHRSNTPLAVRSPRAIDESNKSKLLLIHDYNGSYLEYEACQGADVPHELYTCEHLQLIDSFVYFSHQLVTVPPPTWTNTCHRNGVKVLGTFIIEPGTLEADCILDFNDGQFWVANQLARLARCYGFDGWLINIEKSFSLTSWSSDRLEQFLIHIRKELGFESQVIWYVCPGLNRKGTQ